MLEKRYSKKIEEKWQKYWEENKIYKFEKNSDKPVYSIDSPPPFTSGKLHMGHVLSYSYFDFVARYKRMNGFNVLYPQGWDTQGFPTEVKVEKKYGKLEPKEFVKKCREWTEEMRKSMKEEMIMLGFSPDWDLEYKTMDHEYHEKVQLSLIKMFEKGDVYRAQHPVFYCPHCKSAIAKAETEEKERDSYMNYINFEGPNGEDLTIATTRPELLPACVALMFNPEDKRYKHLEGKKAKTPFGLEVPIIADKDVEKDFGTGLMMVCTFGDKMDVIWAYRYNFPFKQIISEDGRMQNTEFLDGLKVEEARKKIIELIKEKGKLVKQERIKQTIKVHDRCKTPIEFILSWQWFAAIRKYTPKIKEFAKQIKWVPDFGIIYLTDWLDNVEWDWVISRQRLFGTPLPFYYCECGHTEKADKLPFYPDEAPKKICPKCGKEMKPEKAVADCWVDSSITPLIITGWPNEEYKKYYPVDLRPQGVEIVRTWAFYTIYRSGWLTGEKPFKTILLNGNVLAPDGRKMSKSLGNVISPRELVEKYFADGIRQWSALSGAMAKDRPFSYEDIQYGKSFLNKLWNSAKLVQISLKDYSGEKEENLRLVDRWIISRMNEVIEQFTKYMESFEFHHALKTMHQFYWHDFCDHYLEFVKYRIYNNVDKKAAQYTLYYVLLNSIKLLAPIMPHITEEIYHEVFGFKESIHISEWPKSGEIEREALEKGNIAKEIMSKIRQFKSSNSLFMKAELSKIKLRCPDLGSLFEDIKQTGKIRDIDWVHNEKLELEIYK